MAVMRSIRRFLMQDSSFFRFAGKGWAKRSCSVLFGALLACGGGCRSSHQSLQPSVHFTRVPPAGGGPNDMEHISGQVINGRPGMSIVIYAQNKGTWYVQPLRGHPITEIAGNGTWDTASHLGTEYSALLVTQGYRPAPKLRELPSIDANVLAVVTTKASSGRPPEAKVIHFSGYDWQARSFLNDRGGGEVCN